MLGVDGSSSSRVAAEWTARAATMRNAPLNLVHAVSTPTTDSWGPTWLTEPALANLRR